MQGLSVSTAAVVVLAAAIVGFGGAARADRDALASVEPFEGSITIGPVAGWRADCTGQRNSHPITATIATTAQESGAVATTTHTDLGNGDSSTVTIIVHADGSIDLMRPVVEMASETFSSAEQLENILLANYELSIFDYFSDLSVGSPVFRLPDNPVTEILERRFEA